jgi:predicted nuclease of restriction endonuclease-like RecB superfamily
VGRTTRTQSKTMVVSLRARRSTNPLNLCDQQGVIKAFRSQFEDRIARDLCSRKVPFRYEREQDRLQWTRPATHHVYSPDFVLIRPDGHLIYLEAKGRLTGEDMAKMLYIFKQHAELDIRFLFSNAKTSAGRQKKNAGQWADKHGIKWAEARVPESWVKR